MWVEERERSITGSTATNTAMRHSRKVYSRVNRVEVYLWGKRVGTVSADRCASGYCTFTYAHEFRELGIELSPLHMPVEREPYLFDRLPEATYRGLPALLSDSLPDDFGTGLVNRYLAARGVAVCDVTPLDRLAYMGNRAMGALVFRPSCGPAVRKAAAIDMERLVAEARMAVTGCPDADGCADAALRHLIDVGTSAGGARAKAVIAWNRQTGEIRSGQADVPPGFEHWLLKFDGIGTDSEHGVSQEYGRIEYAYHLMAKKAGIRMSECRLLHENGRAHFMTARFDRGNGTIRHHIQTLCAMNHLDFRKKGTHAYAGLFGTIEALKLPYEDKEEAFRRMAFNVMGKNCDDHTKNVSFLLRQGHAWELAPAYDITFAHNPRGEWTRQHQMAVNGKFNDFTRDDLLAEAARFGIGTAERILEQVHSAIAGWPSFADEAGVSEAQAQTIGRQLILL